MVLHICLNSWRSLEIHINEDGRAAGKKTGRFTLSNNLYFNKALWWNWTTKFDLTWIQSKKKHVEKDGSQKDSPQRERASHQQFSVEKPEHGFKFMDYTSCGTQTQSGKLPAVIIPAFMSMMHFIRTEMKNETLSWHSLCLSLRVEPVSGIYRLFLILLLFFFHNLQRRLPLLLSERTAPNLANNQLHSLFFVSKRDKDMQQVQLCHRPEARHSAVGWTV